MSVTTEGLLVSVIIWWLNGSTQSRAWRGTQTAYWWWLVQKHTTDCSLVAADADIFIQLAQLTVIKENETLRFVCMGRRREKNQKGKSGESVQSPFLINRRAVSEISYTQTHTLQPHTHTHARFLVNRHAHEYLRRTEASFPVLLYLMHIKYHFPQKIPQCLIFVGRREILSWLPSTGYYQKLDFITDSSYVFGKSKETQRRQMKRLRWKNNMYGHYFFHVVKSLN